MAETDWWLPFVLLAEAVLVPLVVFGGPAALRFLRGVRAGERSWWEAIPPYAPPDSPDEWKVLATLHLAPKPRLPCGCRAAWRDVNYIHDAEPDGTVRETIGEFQHSSREWTEYRSVEADNGGVWVTTHRGPVHTHECGRSWPEPMDDPYLPVEDPAVERYEHPPDSSTMRALPDGWTRMNRGLAERAGQVSEYVYDETWEAFVDVYETDHDGNSYDPSAGTFCAVLLTGSPSSGLWERDEHYGDDRTGAAKPLMRSYNDGEYE